MRVRRRSIPFLVAALTILGLFTSAPDAIAAGKKSPMIVVLDRDADVDAAVKHDKREHGVKPTNVFKHAARGYAADLTPGQVRAIERERSVMGVIPDSVVELVAQVTPPGVRRVRATSSPLTHINGVDLASHRVNADVAIIDTGIQPNHPDLRVVGGYDCTRPGTRSERSQSSRWRDDHGHGTHVAEIVGALDNTRGVVGVAPGVRLWAVRVFTATGYSRISWIACGIDWVTSKRDPNNSARPLIEVANMSLRDKGTDDRNCGYSTIDIEHQAICRSTARGTLYVVAAGNDSNVAGNWRPASYNEVVTVSAMADYDGKPGGLASAPCVAFGRRDSDDTFADFSNYGLDIDVVAPGVCVRSTYRGSTYATISGTSMATPHVAGAAALFLVAHPGTRAGRRALGHSRGRGIRLANLERSRQHGRSIARRVLVRGGCRPATALIHYLGRAAKRDGHRIPEAPADAPRRVRRRVDALGREPSRRRNGDLLEGHVQHVAVRRDDAHAPCCRRCPPRRCRHRDRRDRGLHPRIAEAPRAHHRLTLSSGVVTTDTHPEPILPPATIGILGGGQLGRMLGFAARAMGYRIVVLDPDPDCPSAAVADRVVVGAYDDVRSGAGPREAAPTSSRTSWSTSRLMSSARPASG